ncbi:hypothetical protein N6L24_14505 [Cognatishimia sp. SS12]|uniref:hypothetical protein n=1 Tax=Cognatishimia sp. SS12 TaxID=2979465 RepID=UPI00232F0522|nr:hypothetical protein [Cognatishimia sp. SS12]MDC0739497.1 hypothetical protein [Cognatishimia sp. SS12]
MLDDRTEIIAHFIGMFELNAEAARMKIQYQEMLARLAQQADLGGLLNVTVNVTSAYGLQDFMAGIKWPLSFVNVPVSNFSILVPGMAGFAPAMLPMFFPPAYFGDDFFNGVQAAAGPVFSIPLPSSMANITVEANYLEDQDKFLNYDAGVEFVAARDFDDALQQLVDTANVLQPLGAPALPQNEEVIAQTGVDLAQDIATLRTDGGLPEVDGATQHVAFGGDVAGKTVNGESVEDIPKLAELRKRFEEKDEEDEDAPLLEDHLANHELSTGQNLLLNEGVVVTNWLDAPMISVMGKAIFAKAISQTNVWNDSDTINGMLHASANSSTQSMNAAAFTAESNPHHSQIEKVEGEEMGDGPNHVVVTRLEGNLINYNHVCQYNFANDSDTVSVKFDADSTFLQMGDNTLYNVFDILGLGFHYDLIVVGGDMIDATFISQTNIMLDSDYLYYQEGFGGTIETSDNFLYNYASISDFGIDMTEEMTEDMAHASQKASEGSNALGDKILGHKAFADSDIMSVLYISGSWLDIQILQQFNILGDADQVALASATVQSAEGADISVLTGGNDLINYAAVHDAGLDSTIYTADGAYSEAFLYQADFVSESDPLMLLDADPLAGEAVLFLADGMLENTYEEDGVTVAVNAPAETTVDVMQSVLA